MPLLMSLLDPRLVAPPGQAGMDAVLGLGRNINRPPGLVLYARLYWATAFWTSFRLSGLQGMVANSTFLHNSNAYPPVRWWPPQARRGWTWYWALGSQHQLAPRVGAVCTVLLGVRSRGSRPPF